MACEPDGCGPKSTCLATSAKARLPSKPPVDSGAGVFSSGCCLGDFAAALTTGDEVEVFAASPELQAARTAKDVNAASQIVARPARLTKGARGKGCTGRSACATKSRSGLSMSGMSVPCRRGLGGELFVFVADDDPRNEHADEIETDHRSHEDEHRHSVRRRRNDGRNDGDDGNGVANVFPEELRRDDAEECEEKHQHGQLEHEAKSQQNHQGQVEEFVEGDL